MDNVAYRHRYFFFNIMYHSCHCQEVFPTCTETYVEYVFNLCHGEHKTYFFVHAVIPILEIVPVVEKFWTLSVLFYFAKEIGLFIIFPPECLDSQVW